MTDKQVSDSGRKAVFEVMIEGSIEAVWHEITKQDEPQQCFFNMWMDTDQMGVGGQLRMRTKSKKYTGAAGEILEFEPPTRYAHTFRFTHLEDPPCIVAYDLEDLGGKVRFRLTVSDMTPGTKSAKQMTQGGTMIVNTLKSMVETGRPGFGTRMLFCLFRAFEPFSPKATRSEQWPL